MPKAILSETNPTHVGFYCEGCKHMHYVNTAPQQSGPLWGFNGDLESPTLTPSVLNRTGHYCQGQKQPPDCWNCNDAAANGYEGMCSVCHIFVTDGMIEYLSDCTHHMAGKKVPLKDLSEIKDD